MFALVAAHASEVFYLSFIVISVLVVKNAGNKSPFRRHHTTIGDESHCILIDERWNRIGFVYLPKKSVRHVRVYMDSTGNVLAAQVRVDGESQKLAEVDESTVRPADEHETTVFKAIPKPLIL